MTFLKDFEAQFELFWVKLVLFQSLFDEKKILWSQSCKKWSLSYQRYLRSKPFECIFVKGSQTKNIVKYIIKMTSRETLKAQSQLFYIKTRAYPIIIWRKTNIHFNLQNHSNNIVYWLNLWSVKLWKNAIE